MNLWIIFLIFFIVVTVIGLAGMLLVDEDFGYVSAVSGFLILLEIYIYLWFRAIVYVLDYSNDKPNTLDWVEVLGFISILGSIFGGSKASSN